jgi:hypothetical protein
MRYFRFITILILFISFGAFAKKNIISKTTPDGVVVMIDRLDIPANDNDYNIKSLKYDITLVSFSDSVSFTATIVSKNAFKPDSASISDSGKLKVEKIYVEPKGAEWKSRLRFYMSYNDFERVKNSQLSPIVNWYVAGRPYSFVLKNSKWKDQQKTWEYASTIIDNNK